MFQDLIDIGCHFSQITLGSIRRNGKRTKFAISNDDNLKPIDCWPSARALAINARNNNWYTAIWPYSIGAIGFDIDSYILEDESEDIQSAARRFLKILGKTPLHFGPSLSGRGFHIWMLLSDDVPDNHELIAKPQRGFIIRNMEGIRKLSGEVFYRTHNPLFCYNLSRLHRRYFDIATKIDRFTAEGRDSDINQYLMRKGDCHRFARVFCIPLNQGGNPHLRRGVEQNDVRDKRSRGFKNLESALDHIRGLPDGCVMGQEYFPSMIAKLLRSGVIGNEHDSSIDDVVHAYLERCPDYSYNQIRNRIDDCIRWWMNESNHRKPARR